MSLYARALYFGRSAAQGIRHRPLVNGIAVLTLALALFSWGLARSGSRLLDSLVASLGANVEVTAYLRDGTTPELAEATARALGERLELPVEVVTPDAALTRLGSQLGDYGDVFSELEQNPLPWSLEIDVPESLRTAEALEAIAAKAKADEAIADVEYGQAAVERLSQIARVLRVAGSLVFLLVVITAVVIVSATLQLAIYARREEIEIQKLVGATDRFVKAPFLLEGLFQGLLGAGVAVGGLWVFSLWALPGLLSLFAFLVGPGAEVTVIGPRLMAELFGAGATLGLGGSFLAVGRFLRV